MICDKRTIGSDIILSMEHLGDGGHVKSCFDPFGDDVSVMQDKCTVCAKCTIGSGTFLDAPDGTPR
jgi:hypothetical protein